MTGNTREKARDGWGKKGRRAPERELNARPLGRSSSCKLCVCVCVCLRACVCSAVFFLCVCGVRGACWLGASPNDVPPVVTTVGGRRANKRGERGRGWRRVAAFAGLRVWIRDAQKQLCVCVLRGVWGGATKSHLRRVSACVPWQSCCLLVPSCASNRPLCASPSSCVVSLCHCASPAACIVLVPATVPCRLSRGACASGATPTMCFSFVGVAEVVQ